jgi:hypothetical protein
MRKAAVDAQTRSDIMGHKTSSMDDRYTMIEDEDLADAVEDMDLFQRARGLCVLGTPEEMEAMKAEVARLKNELACYKTDTSLEP